jgi:hypothetical protein
MQTPKNDGATYGLIIHFELFPSFGIHIVQPYLSIPLRIAFTKLETKNQYWASY